MRSEKSNRARGDYLRYNDMVQRNKAKRGSAPPQSNGAGEEDEEEESVRAAKSMPRGKKLILNYEPIDEWPPEEQQVSRRQRSPSRGPKMTASPKDLPAPSAKRETRETFFGTTARETLRVPPQERKDESLQSIQLESESVFIYNPSYLAQRPQVKGETEEISGGQRMELTSPKRQPFLPKIAPQPTGVTIATGGALQEVPETQSHVFFPNLERTNELERMPKTSYEPEDHGSPYRLHEQYTAPVAQPKRRFPKDIFPFAVKKSKVL
eukprot:TRINITY_DN7280_c0_g1_i2.p1 TRINITY_DN7280_c0_g1~~TRINITY_DN7280_c0_g1_i2.p1  ORF type:complete len:267 (+),score=74.32 TRINITY_DN7280_c0_g1_i2:467-1267(+)